ncbi:MAG TPA: hypothetical protein VFJ90_05380 [Candidatus Didemnitutus sp.]|nr:hypothetical protein [Candidatus Didemnitutus sp.]
MSRIGDRIATAAQYQMQARQNALLGLGIALGELQRHAGDMSRVTGMAGVTGVAAGAGNPTRHWCGVWTNAGAFVAWLASQQTPGASPAVAALPDSVVLIGAISVGNSTGAESENREFVRADKIPVPAIGLDGVAHTAGNYAYWVGDEGVKLSAVIPDTDAALSGVKHAIDEEISVLSPTAPTLASVLAFNQLAFVPTNPMSANALAAGFHQLTVTHYAVDAGGVRRAGRLNVNSTSSLFWKGVAGTYNRNNPGLPLGITTTVFGNRMRSNFAASGGAGKLPNGPFQSSADFLASPLLDTALAGSGVTPAQFAAAIDPLFTVRSDTFRIRGYGDALNPSDATKVESAAFCEAMVQRVSTGGATKFVITQFRWLGPKDI